MDLFREMVLTATAGGDFVAVPLLLVAEMLAGIGVGMPPANFPFPIGGVVGGVVAMEPVTKAPP